MIQSKTIWSDSFCFHNDILRFLKLKSIFRCSYYIVTPLILSILSLFIPSLFLTSAVLCENVYSLSFTIKSLTSYPVLCFQMFIPQLLSQWILAELNTSSTPLSHWAVRDNSLNGELRVMLVYLKCLPVAVRRWPDIHGPLIGLECSGVSPHQESTATLSTSQYTVSLVY